MAMVGERTSRVEIRARPMWRLRLRADLTRYLLTGVSIFGLLASARFAFDPPTGRILVPAPETSSAPDLAAEAYAVLFARRYLTWNAAEPLSSSQALAPFSGTELNPDAGMVLPATGAETVEWAEAVQERQPSPGVRVYTVAAQTDPAGLRYLTVGVRRVAGGALTLAGYPAFVGAPANAAPQRGDRLRPVSDSGLATVVRRALSNYLASSAVELAADLAPGAQVSAPAVPMQLLSVVRQSWAMGGGSVVVEVEASDRSGAQYQLAYELDVVRRQGRWEISAIQTDPDD
jgi:Conjugative transposon protein TcpC